MIYLAGPWFTIQQSIVLESIKSILDRHDLLYYSPKDEMPFTKGGEFSPEKIYNSNIETIRNADLVIVITDGKDVGTIFEAGYAACYQVPIVYIWADPIKGAKFNIMLSQSGEACYLGLEQFDVAMRHYKDSGQIYKLEYKGEVE